MRRMILPSAVFAALLACSNDAASDDADDDGDGIPNAAEEAAGTDPTQADSDGDGLDDGDEADLGTDPLASDTDGDGLSDSDEGGAGTDPLTADTDADALPDGDEAGFGTDPLVPDSDGDGYRDGDEVKEGSDPADEESWIYQGHWPYQPEKDALGGPDLADAEADEGELFARLQLQDQFGDTVDLYDLAGHGKPILVDISAIWCGPCNGLSQWLSGTGDDYGFDGEWGHIKDLVESGDIYWVTILGENVMGGDPSLSSIQTWDGKYPNEHIPVLVGNADIANTYINYAWPSAYFMDENMEILAMPSGDNAGHYDALDMANDYEP